MHRSLMKRFEMFAKRADRKSVVVEIAGQVVPQTSVFLSVLFIR